MIDIRRFGFNKERTLDKYVPWDDYISDDMLIFTDKSAFVMLEIEGLPFETVEDEIVIHQHDKYEEALRGCSTDGLIYHHLRCRGIVSDYNYPAANFSNEFSRKLDSKYQTSLFSGRKMWLNRHYLGIQLRPRRLNNEWIANQTKKFEDDESISDRSARLHRIVGIIKEQLRAYKPKSLRIVRRGKILYSEIAEAVAFAMTGYWRQVPLTANSANSVFSETFFVGWESFEVRMPHASTFGACLGIHDFPYQTFPGMFSPMLSSSYRHTMFHTLRCMPATEGLELATRKQNRLINANDKASTQIEELNDATNLIASNRMMMGAHGCALTVFTDDKKLLPDALERAWGDLSTGGAKPEREDIALEAVLFSQIPGNFKLRGRPAAVSSRNFCAFTSLHNFSSGDDKGFWGDPICILRNGGGAPFRFHLQYKGVGNTLVCGSTGSGKTTWLGFLASQVDRVGAQVIIWDKDKGLESLVAALGGTYSPLSNHSDYGTGLAPLRRLSNTPEDKAALSGIIRSCISTPDVYAFTPEEDRRLGIALDTVMSRKPENRDMMEVRAFLGVSRTGAGARLEKWCWGREYGWVIDCPEDNIIMDGNVIGFDQSALLDNPIAASAVMATIFHYCGKLVDGRKLVFILDEIWNGLKIPQFANNIRNGLATFRKYNSPIILSTQSVADALTSPIAHTIREQCPTQIYFSTPRATWKDFGDEGMNCTRREFDIIKQLPEGDGHFLLKQGDRSSVVSAPLHGMQDEISIISGTAKSVSVLAKAREKTGLTTGTQLIDEFLRMNKETV